MRSDSSAADGPHATDSHKSIGLAKIEIPLSNSAMLGLLVLYLLLGNICASPTARGDGTVVSTAQGPVQGTLVSPNVRQWLGIPYAAAPRDSLRFQPPQSASTRTSTLSATAFGDSCPAALATGFLELVGMLDQQENVPYGEDCLNLNIWAPATSRPQGGAILLWVYGGSFEFGTSNTPYYNGQSFVENHDDIVVVTINYRTNIFGFPTAPQQTVNVGLLDVDAAIQWVYANIAQFGGNPERITIFGESAGAVAVDSYAFSHPEDTIVKGIIAESGTAYISALTSTSATSFSAANSSWNTIAATVGCGTVDDAAQFACMQAVPWQTVHDAVSSTGAGFGGWPDGVTVFPDVSSRSSNGQFLKVPLLIGHNANEGDIFVLADSNSTAIPIVSTVLSDTITELLANCPASKEAGDRATAGVPTWRYIFEGVYPDLTNENPNLHAYHSAEIPLVFGTYRYSTFPYAPTAYEVALSSWMQGAWVAFARNPTFGLADYGWPAYGSNPLVWPLVELGNSNHPSGATNSSAIAFDVGCGAIAALLPVVLEVLSVVGGIL